jgi:hypothetical protein
VTILVVFMILLVVFLASEIATTTIEYCPLYGFGTFCLVHYLWRKMHSLGYLLVLVLLLKSFYTKKVMVLRGGCVPMVWSQYCDIVYG